MAKGTITKMGTGNPGSTQTCVGTIQDDQTGTEIPFQQDYAVVLGLAVGSKVSYETVTIPVTDVAATSGYTTAITGTATVATPVTATAATATQVIANSLTPLEKGKIKTVNGDDQTGTLNDRVSGTDVSFDQPYLSESGISVGSVVSYTIINVPAGGGLPAQTLAVSLVFVRN